MKAETKNGHRPPSEVQEVAREVMAAKTTDQRQPISLAPNGAVMSVIGQVLQQDAMKIALGSFCEGRELKGKWALRIVAAELVPIEE